MPSKESQYADASGVHGGSKGSTKAAGAETASTTHSTLDTTSATVAVVAITVTGSPGGTTPTMTLVVEGSLDGSTWITLGTIGANGYATGSVSSSPTNINAAGTYTGVFPAMNSLRTRSVVGGTTPSFNYSTSITLGG